MTVGDEPTETGSGSTASATIGDHGDRTEAQRNETCALERHPKTERPFESRVTGFLMIMPRVCGGDAHRGGTRGDREASPKRLIHKQLSKHSTKSRQMEPTKTYNSAQGAHVSTRLIETRKENFASSQESCFQTYCQLL